MTRQSAKLLVMPILDRWNRIYLWKVKYTIVGGNSCFRWFRSCGVANDYASMLLGADVSKESFPLSNHPTCTDDYGPDLAAVFIRGE